MPVPPEVAAARAKVASLTRSRPKHDPEFIEARRTLAEANVNAAVERALATAPPLSAEQVDRICALLRKHEVDEVGR